jgi:predicted O-methyltransferase YrrM
MKPWQFTLFRKLLDEIQPTKIAEIGVHNGRTASQMCEHILSTRPDAIISYTGYDAFDELSDHKGELNGKGQATKAKAEQWLQKMKKRYPGRLEYTLIEGFTAETLLEPVTYDFVYVDGGHSYESVLHDWNMLKTCSMLVFDDYCMPGVSKLFKEHIELDHHVEYFNNTDISRAVAVVRTQK